MEKNKTGKYLKYAIGEIILVVIGILIALQINNWNETRKIRGKEIDYLTNLKTDLQFSILELEEFIVKREAQTESAKVVVEHFNGKAVDDWNIFNKHVVSIYTWQRFYLIDNTYQELKNSGNFSIISNDSIKNSLLNLDLLYKKLKYKEDHWRYDAEQTLHPSQYEKSDINSISNNYVYQLSNGQQGELGNLSNETFGNILDDQKQKNGFAFAVFSFAGMKGSFTQMVVKSKEIITLIDIEVSK